MVIALDYDDTYTLDPEFWDEFVDIAHHAHHEVLIVTARPWAEVHLADIRATQGLLELPIYATGLMGKRAYMNSIGVNVDVWIDDLPEWICGCAA